jgi:hypothetical protein
MSEMDNVYCHCLCMKIVIIEHNFPAHKLPFFKNLGGRSEA